MRIVVVIVNYRTPDLTADCLRSLQPQVTSIDAQVDVIVTDNASGDDSVPLLEKAIQEMDAGRWVTLMPLERNGGFAYGNNAAIRAAMNQDLPPDYVWLLNPDTIVRPNAVRELVEFVRQQPKVGVVGTRLEDLDGDVWRSAFRFHTLLSELNRGLGWGVVTGLLDRWVASPPARDEIHETDWVSGASMLVHRAVFEQVGLLDEQYFMYYEEQDFALRASRAGWRCWYLPTSRVVHLVGKASGVTDVKQPQRRRPRYWFESRKRFFRKNYGWLYAAATDVTFLICFSLWRCRRRIQGKPDNDPPHFLWDFFRYSLAAG